MKNKFFILWFNLLLLIGLIFIPNQSVRAAAGITLDGNFGDWAGKPCVSDPSHDVSQPAFDLVNFCFESDLNAEEIVFMIERREGVANPRNYVVRLDNNNDGDFTDPEDRYIQVRYHMQKRKSKVNVDFFDGTWSYISTVASGADWGASEQEGGSQVEFMAPFADLGILPGVEVTVSMDVYSGSMTDILDAPIQWTPANALGFIILTILIVGVSIFYTFLQKKREDKIEFSRNR